MILVAPTEEKVQHVCIVFTLMYKKKKATGQLTFTIQKVLELYF